jgi:hypothetical protein
MSENMLPLEYLVTSSQSAVESFELSRLNRVSNLRKEIRQIVDEWIAAETEARVARWILNCRRDQANDEAPLRSSPTGSLPVMLPSEASKADRGDPLPTEEIPLGAPCGGELPLWNSPLEIDGLALGDLRAEIPKGMTSHTAKAVLRLLEHVTHGAEALSHPMRIRRRPRCCAGRAVYSEFGSSGSPSGVGRRNFPEPLVSRQSRATANSGGQQVGVDQKIRPAPPMRSPYSSATQCNRRRAS